MGRRWRRSRASAISCAPADGDMPNANANGSGVNAATSGVPSPPSDSSASRAAPPKVSTPVSAVAGCRSAQWAASWSLRNAARRSALFGFGGGFEHAGGVEVADLVLLPDRGAHGTEPSIDHRQSRPRIPCIHRGFGHRDPLVTWVRLGPTTRCAVLASLPSCPWEEDSSWPWSRRASSRPRAPRRRASPRPSPPPAHPLRPTADRDDLPPRRPPCPNPASRPASTPG